MNPRPGRNCQKASEIGLNYLESSLFHRGRRRDASSRRNPSESRRGRAYFSRVFPSRGTLGVLERIRADMSRKNRYPLSSRVREQLSLLRVVLYRSESNKSRGSRRRPREYRRFRSQRGCEGTPRGKISMDSNPFRVSLRRSIRLAVASASGVSTESPCAANCRPLG